MGGGLMQLLAVGAQDQYLTAAPSFSYFKSVVKKHTNFSMESVRQTFLTAPVLDSSSSGTFTCRIGRVGDLLQDVALYFELPDIYSDDTLRFRWIDRFAHRMLRSYSVRIDTQLIDQGYGDWLDIWTELTMTDDRRAAYDRMIGNTPEYTMPSNGREMVTIVNNRFTYTYYPESTPTTPSIPRRGFYLPIPFWFTRNPSLALPLVMLQYQFVDISIELRSIEELYQLYDLVTDTYVSPGRYRQLYAERNGGAMPNVGIDRFTSYAGGGATNVPLNAHLECNFIYLDDMERRAIATSDVELLVESVFRLETGGITRQKSVDLIMSNPIKAIYWTLQRDNLVLTNNWSSLTRESGADILDTAKILWNGLDRFEAKSAAYFNALQPYKHYSRSPRPGVYAYSFALYPEKIQPSGSFNASMINKIQLYLTTNADYTGQEYNLNVYATYYNIFRVMSGSGSMAFAN